MQLKKEKKDIHTYINAHIHTYIHISIQIYRWTDDCLMQRLICVLVHLIFVAATLWASTVSSLLKEPVVHISVKFSKHKISHNIEISA